jgi:hypothetical protein
MTMLYEIGLTVTSGLASVLGLLLIFWNKVVHWFFRLVKVFHRPAENAAGDAPKNTPSQAS